MRLTINLDKGAYNFRKKEQKMKLDKNHSLILSIDIQARLCDAIAKSAGQGALDSAIRNAEILLKGGAILEVPRIESLQYVKGLGESALGAEITRDVFEKRTFSVVYENSPLLAYLSQNLHIRQIIICGMEAHICVLQSARDLLGEGYEVALVSDAVISRNPANKENALSFIAKLGGAILNVESVLFDLLQSSEAPQFKAISALIK